MHTCICSMNSNKVDGLDHWVGLQSMQHKKCFCTSVENIHALTVYVDTNNDHLTGSLLLLLLFKAIFWFKYESFFKCLQPCTSLFGPSGLRHGSCMPGRGCFNTSCTRTVPENLGTVPKTTFLLRHGSPSAFTRIK